MEAQNDLVSVIIPTFNSGKYIIEAIDSVLSQTYKNTEIIIVDDGSTDNSKQILKDYISEKKIKYFYQENQKQGAARNNGINQASGNFLAFLDADDIWLKDKLQLQMELFNKDVGLVYGDIILFQKSEEMPGIHSLELCKGNIFYSLLMNNYICASSVVIRRECINKVGFFKPGLDYFGVEDYHMWLKVCYHWNVDFIKSPVLRYRLHEDNMSQDYPKIISKEINVRNDIAEKFKLSLQWKTKIIHNSYFRLSYFLLEEKKYKQSYDNIIKAIKTNPYFIKNYKLLFKLALYILFSRN